jgi:cyclophilin family peptidyl-prolyl cis-trans isomerase
MFHRLFLLILLCIRTVGYAQMMPDQSTLMAHAPATFQAIFHTSKGDFSVEVIREWSPAAADRFYQLVATEYYNQNYLFRVQKNYVVQFGICNVPEINSYWDKKPLFDEPVAVTNAKGTLSYARDGLNSRTTQLFINLKDNPKLDTVNFNGLAGFPPFAKIISGFEVVDALNGEYGFEPANHQDSLMKLGNSYLLKKFPNLDYIKTVTLKLP